MDKNKPPIANAGTDQVISLPTDSVLLDGSASADPDGKIVKWNWEKISGPSLFKIVNTSSAKTVTSSLHEGTYQFQLTVTDNKGLSAADTVAITVNKAAVVNRAPVANAGPNQTITLPLKTVDLDGSASYDPDNNIASYAWTKIKGPTCNIVSAGSVQTRVDNLVEGIYEFELKVTDAAGLYDFDTVEIITNADPNAVCFSDRPKVNAQLIPFGKLSTAKTELSGASAGNKIVFAGGWDDVFLNGSTTADVYDLATQTWSTHTLTSPHLNASVAVNGDNIFFGGGGYFYSDYYPAIDVYNVSNNSWTNLSFSEAKTGVAGAAIGNKVLFAGGFKTSGDYFPNNIEDAVEIYDPSSGTWQKTPLSEARGFITSVTVNNQVYFAGGSNTLPSGKIDIYNGATGTWSTSSFQYLQTAKNAVASANKIYWNDGSCKVEIRNVQTGESTLEYLSRSGFFFNTSVVKDGKIVFIHGGTEYFDIFDPSTNKWSVGVLPQPIPVGAGIICVNDTIYIAGGSVGETPIGNGTYKPILTNQVWKLVF